MAKIFVFEHCGRNVFLIGCSYECPDLKLYGYATDRAIKVAISNKFRDGTCARRSAKIAEDYRASR